MGVIKRYYLVIRDKSNNDYNIINICDRNGNSNRANRLEVIDDLTTHYKDKNEFIDDLLEQGYINNEDVDVFIVSPNSKENSLAYFELVFNSNNKRDLMLKDIIESALDKNLVKEEDSIKYILDRFADLMNYDDEFKNIIDFGYSNVAKKYVTYFRNKKGLKPFYQAKFKDGEWAMNSYPLIRNIVDIIDRFDKYRRVTAEVFEENLDYYMKVTPERRNISKHVLKDIYNKQFVPDQDRLSIGSDLLVKTKKDYIDGQLSFTDYLRNLEFDDEKLENTDLDDNSNDIETKIAVVIDAFKRLPRKVFSSLNDDKIVFNTNMFLTYKEEKDKDLLSNLLSSDLLKDIENYTYNLNRLKMYSPRIYDTDNLSKEVRHYETKIYNRFVNDINELNNAYSWCLLYNKCMENDIEYRKKLGEDNGKVYDKYGEFKSESN